MNNPNRVVHLSSAHDRGDARIRLKMCGSLAAAQYDVFLVIADGLGDEADGGVTIVDVGAPRGRLDRMARVTRRVLNRALALDGAVYHFHDPELLPVGLALKRRGKRVVYDAHEDLAKDVLSKPYIPALARPLVAAAADRLERTIARRLDHVVAATPSIRDKFVGWGVDATDINNFPRLDELVPNAAGDEKRAEVCYVGALATTRGVEELVRAMALCSPGVGLTLAGAFAETGLEDRLKRLEGWRRVDFRGYVPRSEVARLMSRAVAGMVTLHPTPAYLVSLPVKMFEYMSAGLPVIASDFALWRGIIEEAECGLLVDPNDPAAIATAIQWVIDHPQEALAMGARGRRAVLDRYNWDSEAAKLVSLYDDLLHADS
jgi:glycosyltransferase involved in cell wall biosynthesis